MSILTHFAPDPERLATLKECIDNYDVGDEDPYWPRSEWPNNMISRQTVVYGNGTIARENDEVIFSVDSDELDLCVRLAHEAAALMKGVEVGLGSESTDEFSAFWICANVGDTTAKIDEDLIRARFGGTLFPPTTIEVEPVVRMFNDVSGDYGDWEEGEPEQADQGQQTLQKWRIMFQWFDTQREFKDRATVYIGEYRHLSKLSKDNYPLGTIISPGVLPRLILGLTRKGSLCGLFGFSVQS